MVAEFCQRVGEILRRVREEAGFAFDHDFGNRSRACGDDGALGSHRLDEHEPESLVNGRERERIERAHHDRHILAKAGPHDVIDDARPRRVQAQLGVERAASREHEPRVARRGFVEKRVGFEEFRNRLLFDEATRESDDERVVLHAPFPAQRSHFLPRHIFVRRGLDTVANRADLRCGQAKRGAGHVAMHGFGNGDDHFRAARDPATERTLAGKPVERTVVVFGDDERGRVVSAQSERDARVEFRRGKMRVDEIEARPGEDGAQQIERSRIAVKTQPQKIHARSQFPQRRSPVSLPAQIRDGDAHSRGELMAHQIEQVVFRAAALDAGDDVKDVQ